MAEGPFVSVRCCALAKLTRQRVDPSATLDGVYLRRYHCVRFTLQDGVGPQRSARGPSMRLWHHPAASRGRGAG